MKGGYPDQYYWIVNKNGVDPYTDKATNAAIAERRLGDPGNPGDMDELRLNRWAIVEAEGDDYSKIINYYDNLDVRSVRTDNLQLIMGGG